MTSFLASNRQFLEDLVVANVGSGIAILGALWIADRSAKHATQQAEKTYRQQRIEEENRPKQFLEDEDNRRRQSQIDQETQMRK